MPRFVTAAKLGQPLRVFGDGRQTRCFCHVRDAVEAMVRLQRSPRARGQIFNVGSHEEISIGKLAQSVIRFLESESAIVRIPYRTAYGRGFSDLRQRRPDLRKLARTIGFVPKTRLREMIENTAAEP